MHPLDDLAFPLSLVVIFLLLATVGWALGRAWVDTRRETREMRRHAQATAALHRARSTR